MCFRFLVKYILFFVNLVFTLIGLALIGIGIAVIYKFDQLFEQLSSLIPINLKFVPYVAIGLGAVIFLIAFSGCCGSIIESKCLLVLYAIFMAILAAIKIYVAVQLFTNMAYFRGIVETELNKTFLDPQLNATFHALETVLQCCGTTGPDSYNVTINGIAYVAPTCCKNPNQDTICLKENAFQTGCTTLISEMLQTLGESSRLTLIIIIAVELLAMIFALYIANTIKR